MQLHTMLRGNVPPNGLEYFYWIRLLPKLQFLHDDQLTFIFYYNQECRAAASPKRFVAALDGQLYVLRVEVAAENDEQVAESTSYKKFPVSQKAQVACSQERAFARVGKISIKDAGRFLRL